MSGSIEQQNELLKAIRNGEKSDADKRRERERENRQREIEEAIKQSNASPRTVTDNDLNDLSLEMKSVIMGRDTTIPKDCSRIGSIYYDEYNEKYKNYKNKNKDQICNEVVQDVNKKFNDIITKKQVHFEEEETKREEAGKTLANFLGNTWRNSQEKIKIQEAQDAAIWEEYSHQVENFLKLYKAIIPLIVSDNNTLEEVDLKKTIDDFYEDAAFRKRVLCTCHIQGNDAVEKQVETFIENYYPDFDTEKCVIRRIKKIEPPSEPQTFRDQLKQALEILNKKFYERLSNKEDYNWALQIVSEAHRRGMDMQELKDAKKPKRLEKILSKADKLAKKTAKEIKNKSLIKPKWKNGGKRTKKSYKKSKKANTRKHKKSNKVTFKKNKKTRKH